MGCCISDSVFLGVLHFDGCCISEFHTVPTVHSAARVALNAWKSGPPLMWSLLNDTQGLFPVRILSRRSHYEISAAAAAAKFAEMNAPVVMIERSD
eukprot:COSAG01_NODE_3103_length_6578_cov_112.775428_4_plen_96_part_00